MVQAKENQSKRVLSEELKRELKAALKEFSVQETADKFGLPYHTVYHYSPLNKNRKARVVKQKGKRITVNSVIKNKIAALEAQKEAIDLQIRALESVIE
jgi:hypothetical protein